MGFFHQNAHTLQKQFQLTATEAREIVESCDDCHTLGAPLPAGVNPRGLKALELWQTDVTQVAEFGRLKYVHVMVDTFSSAMWASAHTGEKVRDITAHWRQAFAVLGIPSAVKTNNGPAYALQQRIPQSQEARPGERVKSQEARPGEQSKTRECLYPMEFQLWESAWRRLLSDALPSLLVDPETAVDEEENALTLDHLMGEGRWTAPVDQANIIPPKALDIVRDHAMTAFFGMAPDGPITPYSKIFQEQEESFTAFVERLTRAVELQIPDVTARRGILREMAFNNANSLCRTAVLSLPLDPPPTLAEMLQVCQIKVPLLQAGETSQQKKTPKVATATTQPSSGPTPQRRPYTPNRQRCYLCGDVGHWATQCYLKKDFDNFKNKKGGGGGEGQVSQMDNQKN
ncbi:hypothetical protein DUI87_30749 [Hirundo rustica rustica]|uniref:RNA-directed DNA polymerase n=1 Tax=Hirundo rustica rustica TaxID=333673 RepID=A0A3M0IW06_HIRRU|nr:hypothetical protein DUI87_30749 [Hirundo rustica rustica]